MPRIVRIATIALGGKGGPTVTANRQLMAGLVEQALAEKPDILAIPESFTLANLAEPRIEEMAEDVPGPTLEMVSNYARAHRAYILCPILARRPDGLHIEAFRSLRFYLLQMPQGFSGFRHERKNKGQVIV